MATKLKQTYTLSNGKTMEGVARAVEELFRSFSGCTVTSVRTSRDSWKITCITGQEGMKGKIGEMAHRSMGLDLDTSVTMYQDGKKLEIHYFQNINEIKRVFKGLVGPGSILYGIPTLGGVYDRHELPVKINKAIRNYLYG